MNDDGPFLTPGLPRLARQVISVRNYRINPGGLIHYVGTTRDAVMQAAEKDRLEQDPYGIAAAMVKDISSDHRGFWFASLHWHSSE